MNEVNRVPKWQRELKSFIGIKSGIILEGNVYDEYPIFQYEGEKADFEVIDGIDQTILSLVDRQKTEVYFFDPLLGFYVPEGDIEAQRAMLAALFDGYSTDERKKDYGCTLCLMPCDKRAEGKSGGGSKKYIWVSEIIRRMALETKSGAEEKSVLFVLNFASRLESCNLSEADSNTMFLNLLAATTVQTAQSFCNSVIMVVDKYNDIPVWLYLNNPNIRTVSVCVPDRSTRRLYLKNLYGQMLPFQLLGEEGYEVGRRFVAETEGLQLREISQILKLAYRKDIKPDEISRAFRLYKYGVTDDPWENLENDILTQIWDKLAERVKGQNEALEKVKSVVTRAVKGLSGIQHSSASHKPKGVLFFAGPTGVGKTETAKALAEAVFGDENACIRFDMSEYRLEHSDQKLFGAPPGYVGYEGGGQLTNAVKNRPFSVILFDEIEKASPTILDKFLQILEDGRMTDNQGNTVYFGETIIIFTSNIGLTKEVNNADNLYRSTPHRIPTVEIEDPMKEDSPAFRAHVTALLTESVKDYFRDNGRPELLNRLGDDNIVVFQFINVEDAKAICDYKLARICSTIESEKGIRILTNHVEEMLREKAVMERGNGGRGIGNMLERELLKPLADYICTLDKPPLVLKCHDSEKGIEFEAVYDEA